MKKITTSLSIIAIVAGISFGAIGVTGTYFSDVETAEDNVFQAGTLDLNQPTVTNTYKIDDLKPSEVRYLALKIKNIGSNPLDLWKHIKNIRTDEGDNPEPELEWCNNHPDTCPKNNIDDVILYDMWIEVGGPWNEYNPGKGDELIVSEGEDLDVSDVESHYIYLDELGAEETIKVVQSYHMRSEVGNWAQGDTMTLDVEFYGTQTNGDAPTPELSGHER